MSPILRRIFSRKTLVRGAFALAVLVTLFVAFHVEEGWRGRRAWSAYQAEAARRGVKLRIEEYVAPPVADAENFAAIPIFQEAFRAIAVKETAPDPFELKSTSGANAPRAADLIKGTRRDLTAWRDYLLQVGLLDAASAEPARDVLRGLEHYEPALRQLHEAGARPHSRFPVQWEKGFAAELPHIRFFQSAMKLLTLKCAAHLALGESASAYGDLRDAIALYHGLAHEPVLICGLVRIGVLASVESEVGDGLGREQWAEPELRDLAGDFGRLRLLDDLAFALNSERAGINVSIGSLVDAPAGELAKLALLSGAIDRPIPGPVFAVALYPRGWLLQSQVLINQLFDGNLAQIDTAAGVVRPGSSDERLRAIVASRSVYYRLASMTMPAVESVERNYLAAHTRVQQTQTACALELFRRSRGAYPDALAALVPDFLPAVPIDVADGAPLRYRRTPDGRYELWSIGANRHDDNAAADPQKPARDQPDWVWRLPAKP